MADHAPGATKDNGAPEAAEIRPPLPPGRCPRCGEQKDWLRAGEVCAPCRATQAVGVGSVAIEREEDEMARAKTGTCPQCGEEFEQSKTGKLKAFCGVPCRLKASKKRLSSDGGRGAPPDEEEDEEEAPAAPADGEDPPYDPDFRSLCRFAESIGVDPVEALLEAIRKARES